MVPDIKVGEDSLDIVSGLWREKNLDIFLVCLLVGTQSKKCQKSVKNLGLVETVQMFCISFHVRY